MGMPECTECSIHSKIGLMIAVSVDDTMRCSDLIEWVEQMFEATIHAIEEISGDTEEFDFFSVDFFYDIAEECLTIDMSYMDIGDEGNFFTMPEYREILDSYIHRSYHYTPRMIERIECKNKCKNKRYFGNESIWKKDIKKTTHSNDSPDKNTR